VPPPSSSARFSFSDAHPVSFRSERFPSGWPSQVPPPPNHIEKVLQGFGFFAVSIFFPPKSGVPLPSGPLCIPFSIPPPPPFGKHLRVSSFLDPEVQGVQFPPLPPTFFFFQFPEPHLFQPSSGGRLGLPTTPTVTFPHNPPTCLPRGFGPWLVFTLTRPSTLGWYRPPAHFPSPLPPRRKLRLLSTPPFAFPLVFLFFCIRIPRRSAYFQTSWCQ